MASRPPTGARVLNLLGRAAAVLAVTGLGFATAVRPERGAAAERLLGSTPEATGPGTGSALNLLQAGDAAELAGAAAAWTGRYTPPPYHLSPPSEDGNSTCDYGTPVPSTECLAAGVKLLEEAKVKPGRNYLTGKTSLGSMLLEDDPETETDATETETETDATVTAAIGTPDPESIPSGCSIKTGGDWSVAWEGQTASTNGGKYSLVCSEPKAASHLAPKGDDACDHGTPIDQKHCLTRGNTLLTGTLGLCKGIDTPNAPIGCSIQTVGSSTSIYFNNDKLGKNDGTYSLVCSGLPASR